MNLLCGFFQNIWDKFYYTCVLNIEPRWKSAVGVGIIVLSLIIFVFSTKKSKKGEVVGRWWLFWISSILLVCGVIYLNL